MTLTEAMQPDAGVAAARAAGLRQALENVRVARPSAVQVLNLTNDPNSTGAVLSKAIETDPLMAAQVMRLANSAAFGMSGKVGNTQMAVSIIGFSAIRSLATMLATGVQDHKTPTPPGFWEHAAAAAAACAIVGPRFGAGQGDAFSVGLIHDLGHAILHGVDPQTHTELVARAGSDGAAMCAAEVAAFGMDHAQACARVLSDWNFPAPAVEAIAMHHVAATPDSPALQATLVAANAVAHIVNEPGVDHGSRVAQLAVLGMEGSGLKLTLELTAEYTGEILATLPNRRS